MKIRTEAKIGIGVTLALFALIWGLAFLKGKNIFSSENFFYAKYQKIEGLVSASPVMMNGFKIGTVQTIDFENQNSGTLVVEFTIDQKYIIPKGSIAKIASVDLMGTKALKIIRGTEVGAFQSGDTVPSDIERDLADEVNRQIAPLKQKAEKLMGSMDSVLIGIQQVFTPEAQGALQSSITSISKVMSAFERASLRIDTLIVNEKRRLASITQNVDAITQNLEDNNATISRILNNTAQISDSLAKLQVGSIVADAKSSLAAVNDIVTKINNGEGTMGALLHNDTLYRNLENATRNLDYLLVDIRKNPKKYVRFSLIDRGNSYVLDEESMKKLYEKQATQQKEMDKKAREEKKKKTQ